MKNNKKISVALLSIITLASLVGCNSSGSSSVAPSSNEPVSSAPVSSSVEPEVVRYDVTFEGANTKAFGLPAKAEAGTAVSFTVVASNGYVLKEVKADGATLSGNANDGFAFTMPEKGVKITATAVKEDEQFNLTFNGAHTKAFGLPAKALAGQEINFYVKADDGYSVKSVAIEGVTLNGSVSDGFKFVMPNKAITINATAEAIPQGLDIAFEGTNAYAVGLPAQAKAGDTVNFRIAAASGYAIKEVAAEGNDGALIRLKGSLEEGYSFTMPEQGVKITASAVGAFFKAETPTEKNDDSFVFKAADENASKKYCSDFIKGFVADGKVTSGQTLYARAGETVYVLVDNISIADGVSVVANGTATEHTTYEVKNEDGSVKDTYNAYKFVMPAGDVNLRVNVAKEKVYTVKPSSDTYYTAKTYKLVNDEPVYTTKFNGGETAYVEFALKMGYQDKYVFSSVYVNYETYSSYSMKTTSYNSAADKVSEGVYKFKVSTFTNYAADIVMDVQFKEVKYSGMEFVGKFGAFEFYGATKPTYKYGDIEFDAAGTGKIISQNVEIAEGSLNATNKTFTANNKGTTTAYRDVHFDGDVIWASYYSDNRNNDIYFGLKGITNVSEIDLSYNSDYSMNAVAYVRAFRKGTTNLVGSFIKVNNTIYLNPEIELVNGSTEVTNSASFKVKKDGAVVYEHNCAPAEDAPAIVGQWKYNSLIITVNADGTGTFNNGSVYNFTYSWNAGNKVATLSAFAVWDDNTLTYKETNDTLVAYFDEEWHEETFTATFTRLA